MLLDLFWVALVRSEHFFKAALTDELIERRRTDCQREEVVLDSGDLDVKDGRELRGFDHTLERHKHFDCSCAWVRFNCT